MHRPELAFGAAVTVALSVTVALTVAICGALFAVLSPRAVAGPGHGGRQAHGPGGPPAPALLATPVLSPSRAPLTLQGLQAQQDLSSAMAADMSAAKLTAPGAAASCALVAQGGQVVYADHPDRPVVPASNMKLVTATALIDRLGPRYRFETRLESSRPPRRGVLRGDVYVVGGGDPLLRLPGYAATVPGGDPVYTNVALVVRVLKEAGVHRITGSVVGDASRYDSLGTVASWPERYSEEGDVGQLSALAVDDGFALGGPPVPDDAPPAQQAAGVVTHLLRKAGIAVGGPPLAGRAPEGLYQLGELTSPRLGRLLGEVLRESDNTAMELLTKELGLEVYGRGSTAAGTAAVRADLRSDGLAAQGLHNVDGSGLSADDRVTCRLLVAVLERAGPDGLLVRDLPVAARSGTLAGEFSGTAAAGRLRAKTGTLDHVKALSGWVSPLPGQGGGNPRLARPVVFACVLNGLPLVFSAPGVTPETLTQAVGLAVAHYPRVPALARYEP